MIDDSICLYDERFEVGPIDRDFTSFATQPVLNHPIILSRITKSKHNPHRFFTTVQCYDDAMDFIEGVEKHHKMQNMSTKHWRLVHGILQAEGKQYGHAWIERNNTVYESRLLSGQRVYSITDKTKWRAWWQPEYVREYTISEAKTAMKNSPMGNAGPWDVRILTVANHFLR
jgi:hypothetical protein